MAKQPASPGPKALVQKLAALATKLAARFRPRPKRTTADDVPLTTHSGASLVTRSGKTLTGDLR